MPRHANCTAAGAFLRMLCLSVAALLLLGDAATIAHDKPQPQQRPQREVQLCDTEDESSVSLLQTGMAKADGSGVVAAAAGPAHLEAKGRRVWAAKEKPVSNAILYVLPVLGFAAAMAAILGTVVLEKGWWSSGPVVAARKFSDQIGFNSSPRGNLDTRLPGAGMPRVGARANFGGGAAGALLGGAGGFGPPLQNEHLYHRPQSPPQSPHAEKPSPQWQQPSQKQVQYETQPSPPLTQTFPTVPEAHVVVPMAPQGGYLGLNLSESDLIITGFALPTARGYGFLIGDKLMAINGMGVNHQDDFVYWLDIAMLRNRSHGEPIDFTVWRQPAQQPQQQQQHEGQQHLVDAEHWLGIWESSEYSFEVVSSGNGQLHYGQRLDDAEVASGPLRPVGGAGAEAELSLTGGRPHGAVRLRRSPDGSIHCTQRHHGEEHWGNEVQAVKVEAVRTTDLGSTTKALRPPVAIDA